MSCDLCGKVTTTLVQLKDDYRTDDCSMVCNDCEKLLNKYLSDTRLKLFRVLDSLMKAFIRRNKLP
jgi:hypothetical protein